MDGSEFDVVMLSSQHRQRGEYGNDIQKQMYVNRNNKNIGYDYAAGHNYLPAHLICLQLKPICKCLLTPGKVTAVTSKSRFTLRGWDWGGGVRAGGGTMSSTKKWDVGEGEGGG